MESIDRIRARWDAQAAPQLRAEVERLRVALKATEARAAAAEHEAQYWRDVAEGWREDLLEEIDRNGTQPALTQSGRLVAL